MLPSLRAEREGTCARGRYGTSGVRAALFNTAAKQFPDSLVALPSESYSAIVAGDDVNPDALIESVAAALDLAVARAEESTSHIDYVALACFWHSLVGVDDAGNAITPLLGWADLRAADEAVELRARFDETQTHVRPVSLHPSYWPANCYG